MKVKYPRLLVVVILLTANFSAYSFISQEAQQVKPAVYFFSVGQGDAEMVQARKANILIDTGPSGKIVSELDKVVSPSRRVIDLTILTHPNYDHFGGLFEVLKAYRVRLVVVSGAETPNGEYLKLEQELAKAGIPVVYARQGEAIGFAKGELKIIWPDFGFAVGQELADNKLNDSAIVALLQMPQLKVLFSGDISAKVEKKIVSLLPDIDVLKVAHHGSKYSSTQEFLQAIKPELAVIETGKNNYGHPTVETLERLREVGAQVLRTDLNGTVKLGWEGNDWSLKYEE